MHRCVMMMIWRREWEFRALFGDTESQIDGQKQTLLTEVSHEL